jgi:hypothetical protein
LEREPTDVPWSWKTDASPWIDGSWSYQYRQESLRRLCLAGFRRTPLFLHSSRASHTCQEVTTRMVALTSPPPAIKSQSTTAWSWQYSFDIAWDNSSLYPHPILPSHRDRAEIYRCSTLSMCPQNKHWSSTGMWRITSWCPVGRKSWIYATIQSSSCFAPELPRPTSKSFPPPYV